jgi:peroxiredoxin
MRSRSTAFAVASCLLLVANRFESRAVGQTERAAFDAVEAELRSLGEEYKRVETEWLSELPANGAEESDRQLSDEEWMRKGRAEEAEYPGPDEQLLPRFVDFAKRHPESPFALDALAFVIQRGGPQTGDVLGNPWQLKETAIDMVADQHMDDPRVVHVFEMLSGSLPSNKTEAFLRNGAEQSDDPALRACAELNLARYLDNFRRVHERSDQLQHKPKPLNYERFWKLVVTPYLREKFPCDSAKISDEVERLLAHVAGEYADTPAMDFVVSGPAKVFLKIQPYDPPMTYGQFAQATLFEVMSLVPGKQAPEIEGVDADGKHFRLSDYRGNVILLTFSANWCGGCVELYPLERKLVEKYRDQPFALLSVSRDEQIETLKSSIKSGDITWRCWWDGMHGPIYRAWNSPGAPKLYLLDHDGTIQSAGLNRFTPQADFEEAIDKLLDKIPATPSRSR